MAWPKKVKKATRARNSLVVQRLDDELRVRRSRGTEWPKRVRASNIMMSRAPRDQKMDDDYWYENEAKKKDARYVVGISAMAEQYCLQ